MSRFEPAVLQTSHLLVPAVLLFDWLVSRLPVVAATYIRGLSTDRRRARIGAGFETGLGLAGFDGAGGVATGAAAAKSFALGGWFQTKMSISLELGKVPCRANGHTTKY